MNNKVTFLEFKIDFKEYLNGIDILVHLADKEPFGRVLIEAMSLENPVIARSSGGSAGIVHNEISGFLMDGDPATVADKKVFY